MATDCHDGELWRHMSAELGWSAVVIPECYGGLGMGCVELVALCEAMGETLVCSPFFSTVCLAARALILGGTEQHQKTWLPPIATGEVLATVAWREASDTQATHITTQAVAQGQNWVLTGTKVMVIDGHTSDMILVAAREPGSVGLEGVHLFVVPGDAVNLTRTWTPTMDQTRKMSTVTLDGVVLPQSARLRGGASTLTSTLSHAAVALSAEQVGGASAVLRMAVEYAKVREQFGRAIGSFQAIKHMCADMLVRVESARSASYYAAWCIDQATEDVQTAVATAQAMCGESYYRCAADNIQIHGGIGFTWEHDAHLYFKRARSARGLLGLPSVHRERVASILLD